MEENPYQQPVEPTPPKSIQNKRKQIIAGGLKNALWVFVVLPMIAFILLILFLFGVNFTDGPHDSWTWREYTFLNIFIICAGIIYLGAIIAFLTDIITMTIIKLQNQESKAYNYRKISAKILKLHVQSIPILIGIIILTLIITKFF